ncbi:hypothetical protein [Gorillibacterium sp. sgz5001074]|uniref:hypothetical protein n=1 Tax=Gorillibacterium sp. sgz5001074 TaxID=3446695 RepID=UPI003F67CFF9
MLKKIAATALLLSVVATGAACSSKDKDTAASPAASQAASPAAAATTENPDAYKLSSYTAVRLAEEKLTILFHTAMKDDKPILNAVIANDKEKAAKFLNAYFDPALTEKILSHYLTADKTADGAIIVNSKLFFPVSVLTSAPTKDDVTFEGTAAEVKITTKKDNVLFTVKKNAEGKYIVADVAKK